jgi:hypothetical protein
MRDARLLWLPALAVLAAGVALRLWRIDAEPLWLDEAYSAYAARHGFAFLWQVVPRYETHPPFYYSLLHLWTLAFGDGLRALRLLGILCGLATLPVVAWAADEAGRLLGWPDARRRRLRLVAFALACLAPSLVEMARQVRPYPVMILVYAAAIALLLRLARRRAAGQPLRGPALAAYLLLLEAMLWLHNLGPLYAAALTAALGCMLWGRRLARRDALWLVAGHLLVGLGWLPALLILADQAPAWIGSTWLRFVPDGLFRARLASLYAPPGWPLLVAGALALAAVLRLARRGGAGARLGAMLLVLALLPVLLSITLSWLVAPVFISRTLRPVAVPALLLIALGAAAWDGWRARVALLAALALGGGMLAAGLRARAGPPMQDWYPTVAWLRGQVAPGDVILAYPNEGALPLTYALRDRRLAIPIRPIPGPVPSLDEPGAHYPNGTRGVPSLPPARLHAIALAPQTAAIRTLWLLRLARETYDPGDVFLTELRRGRTVVRVWRHGPIEIVGLRRRPAPARNRR